MPAFDLNILKQIGHENVLSSFCTINFSSSHLYLGKNGSRRVLGFSSILSLGLRFGFGDFGSFLIV